MCKTAARYPLIVVMSCDTIIGFPLVTLIIQVTEKLV